MDERAGFSRMALLGVGYMGGSLALAARAAGLVDSVVGYDLDAAALAHARARGVVDEVVADAAAAVAGADLVVLAAPVGAIGALAAAIAPALKEGALVVDLGSVKRPIAQPVTRVLGGARFVPCHPMAGAESVGVAAADARLYRDRVCLLCPVAETSAQALERAAAFWRALGARPLLVEAGRHDRLMAAVSHLPHAVAFALAATAGAAPDAEAGLADVGGPTTSLRDGVRIAASGPVMWRDIFLANAADLLPLLSDLEARLGELRTAITRGDGATLLALLSEARAARERLMGAGARE